MQNLVKIRRVIAGAALVAATCASQGSAAVNYAFVADVANLDLTTGQTGLVSIYLVETVSGGDSSLIASEHGLEFAQVTVQREQPAGATIASYALNSAFNDEPFTANVPASAPFSTVDISQAVTLSATQGVYGAVNGNVTSVFLMTLVVNAAPSAGPTSFSLTDFAGASETFTFDNDVILDSQIASGVFTVTTSVPEPASVGFLIAGSMGMLRRRRVQA